MAASGISLKLSIFFYWLILISRRFNLFIGDMYNIYTCPLQPCRHLILKVLIQGHPQSSKVPWTLKVPISPLLLILEVVKPTYRRSWTGNLLVWSDLTLEPLLQG